MNSHNHHDIMFINNSNNRKHNTSSIITCDSRPARRTGARRAGTRSGSLS